MGSAVGSNDFRPKDVLIVGPTNQSVVPVSILQCSEPSVEIWLKEACFSGFIVMDLCGSNNMPSSVAESRVL